MIQPPLKIRALRDQGILEIQWTNERCLHYPFKFVRCECPCATCVNEFTGERILDPDTISEAVVPVGVTFCGNYALKIDWNDGHSTGIYTWELLDRMAEDRVVTSVPVISQNR